ncbi:hypothetical protein [Winogradskyella poriferorum]|uniref:hypothetical protein n=1 Tax=Winogradskyella poriferorum TaxID=307627 RepID=UPI003D654695
MKRLILILALCLATISCGSNDDGPEYSAIAVFIGEWDLEVRTINSGLPEDFGEESIVFSEDNNFEDLIGRYTLSGDTESSGIFSISGLPYDLNFEDSTGSTLSSAFNIVDGILTLEYTNDNGDSVREIWRKVLYNEEEE